MNRIRKITKWLFLLSGVVILLTAAAFVTLPRLVNLEIVKGRLLEQLSTAIGADLQYEQVNLELFPRLRLVLNEAAVSSGPHLTGRVNAIHVYPAIFAVLEGKIRIDTITLEQPDLQFHLPAVLPERQFDYGMVLNAVKPVFKSILSVPAIGPAGLFIDLRNGRVLLHNGSAQPFELSRIQLRIQCVPDSIRISARSESNLTQKITFNGRLNARKWNGSGVLSINRLRPGPIFDYLFPRANLKLIDGVSDLQLGYRFDADRLLELQIEAGRPDISLSRNGKPLRLSGYQVRATIKSDSNRTSVSLAELQLNQPRLTVSGNFYYNRKQPEIRMDLTGLDIDVAGFRKATGVVVGQMLWSKKLFAVLKNGRVPFVSLSAITRSWQQFEKIENYLIKGSLGSGDLHIPGIDMDLTDVRGDVVIADGILSGSNLDGRYEKSTGNAGLLELGLTRADPRFHLDVDIDAAVSQVPTVLQRLFAGSYIAEQSRAFHKLRGRARGKLVCGDSLNRVDASVSIATFNLYAVHENIPFPLILQGGRMSIDQSGWVADDLRAQIGLTTLSDLGFKLDFGTEPYLALSAREMDVDLAEARAIFTAGGSQQTPAGGLEVLKGIAFLQDLTIEGPFFNSEQWHTQWSGSIADVLLQTPDLADPILLDRGELRFSGHHEQKKLVVISTDMQWQRSRITAMGDINFNSHASQVDLKLFVDRFDYNQIARLTRSVKRTTRTALPHRSLDHSITGRIKVITDSFTLHDFNWQPVEADLLLNPEDLKVDIVRAQLCNIDTPGELKLTSETLEMSFAPLAQNQNLAAVLQCLDEADGLITGSYSLNGRITGAAPAAEMPAALQGNIILTARDGRIHRYGLVAKITALLNVTEVFRGRLPDVNQEGFAYEKIKLKLDLRDGKLLINESTIQGTTMTIVSSGEIDLLGETVDMTVLFAPFKTIDTIIKNLPVVKQIMGGKLISIPFRVRGPLDDYEVKPMQPTAVDSGVFGLMKKTLRLPLTIWQPMHDGEYTFDEEKLDKYRGQENVGDH